MFTKDEILSLKESFIELQSKLIISIALDSSIDSDSKATSELANIFKSCEAIEQDYEDDCLRQKALFLTGIGLKGLSFYLALIEIKEKANSEADTIKFEHLASGISNYIKNYSKTV
jgi:hypothetical protein